ncbi:MAG: initiation factor 2B-like protein [Chloroflexi bacterium OLB15]|nr:MAG: initiation factor 2B-like protein [Chloroflexi bacterium OLB15]
MHPDIERLVEQFKALELHATRSGREVMLALAQVAEDSHAGSLPALMAEIDAAMDALLEVMQPYAPPLNVMHRVQIILEEAEQGHFSFEALQRKLIQESEILAQRNKFSKAALAQYVTNLIPDGAAIFTFTLSETVLSALLAAHHSGKTFRVLVTESRPNNDGLITAAELSKAGIPVSVSIDACMGELILEADLMIVGAEAINSDGSAIAKVGTYPAALLAKIQRIPVFVVVDTLKFNVASLVGLSLKLDPLVFPHNLAYRDLPLRGHLFDITPASLITNLITEHGVFSPTEVMALISDMPQSTILNTKLASYFSNLPAS